MGAENFCKTPYSSPWFSAKNLLNQIQQTRIPWERASQEEQNDTKFSFIAPSTLEKKERKQWPQFWSKRLIIVHGFWPESENFDFGKKRISSERASQEEQNGANFSFIAPSSEELWVRKDSNG